MERPFLVGREIYLRPIETADAARFVVWLNDPEVTRTLLSYRPVTLAFEREWIERAATSETDLVLGIALRRDDRLIGAAGLHRIDWRNRNAGFGIHIGEKALWGRGYGTDATRLVTGYAFETLNLHRVWLHVHGHNERGMRAYEKAGYRREGVLREDSYREGRYRDTHVMGILRSEWKALASGKVVRAARRSPRLSPSSSVRTR